MLFREICSSYGLFIKSDSLEIKNVFDKFGNQNKQYTFAKIRELADSFILNYSVNKNISDDNINKEIKIELTPFFAFLFLLSKMPLGLPDCFVQLIFKKEERELFDERLISKYIVNNWNYINTDIQFGELLYSKENNHEKFEKYSIKYILKALKLYSKILYYYIEKDRIKIKYPDENIHLIFNSYNNEGIWKSNIPDIKDEYNNEINENEFIDTDFNIKNHKENIYNLISYLINKLNLFDNDYVSMEYLVEILLLFPSYFFLKKICKHYIIKCLEFCRKCERHYDKLLENNENLNKINEFKKKFNYQNARLFLFLYSISNELPYEEQNFPDDKRFKLELNILKFIKNKGNELEDILTNKDYEPFLTLEKKFILYYQLAKESYSMKGKVIYSEDLLNQALSFANRNKFLKHRINNDLCHILLASIKKDKKDEKGERDEKEKNISFVNVIKKKINLLDELMANYFNKKLYDEESILRQDLYDLIEPNIIMLNANPLNNGFSLLSSGIYAKLNNQYNILDTLNEMGKHNQIKSNIRMKSYILNKENLKEALKKDGEILIIQSDDYTEEGDIILESDDGISEKLSKKEFKSLFSNDNIIHFQIILLCFFNSKKYSNIFKNEIKNKIHFKYLVYFEEFKHEIFFDIDNAYLKTYNQHMIELIIEIISSYQEYNIDNIIKSSKENFNSKLQKNEFNVFPKCNFIINGDNSIIENQEINPNDNGIFFFSPFLNLPTPVIIQKDIELNNYATEIFAIINEIKNYKRKECYCYKFMKYIYIQIGFEVIKFFYRHKIFFQFYCVDMENDFEIELINEQNNKIKKNKQFYLIYNCRFNNSLEMVNYLLKNDISYMIIYDKEEDSYLEDNKYKRLYFNKDISYNNYYIENKNKFSVFKYKCNYSDVDSDDDYLDEYFS